MTTLYEIYDAAFDAAVDTDQLDLSSRDSVADYLQDYADNAMDIILGRDQALTIADVYLNYKKNGWQPEFQDHFYRTVKEPLLEDVTPETRGTIIINYGTLRNALIDGPTEEDKRLNIEGFEDGIDDYLEMIREKAEAEGYALDINYQQDWGPSIQRSADNLDVDMAMSHFIETQIPEFWEWYN